MHITTNIDGIAALLSTKPPTDEDWLRILDEAHAAAREAVEAEGPEDTNALNCGMAWVVLRPATHPFVAYCRKQFKAAEKAAAARNEQLSYEFTRRYGHKHWAGGWEWYKPGRFAGQAIGHHIAGAQAFRNVLAKHNISAEVGSRYD